METKHKYYDGINWIVERYFSLMSEEPFTYKGTTYHPKPLLVSPLIARSVDCFPGCGACCLAGVLKTSLDYLPSEKPKKECDLLRVERREVEISHGSRHLLIEIWSDFQEHNQADACSGLDMKDGRCKFYPDRPFNCDFALIMTNIPKDSLPRIATRNFGRSWNMKRVTGEKGALCKINPPSMAAREDVLRKLNRLKEWCEHFGFEKNKVQKIIDWLEGWVKVPELGLYIPATNQKKRGFGL